MNTKATLTLLSLSLIWGCSFIFIKVGVESFSPIEIALLRTLLGSAVILIIVRARGLEFPHGHGLWWRLAIAGAISNTIPYVLFGYGEIHISAILAGLLNAMTPLVTFPVAIIAGIERSSSRRVLGLTLGFLGVLVVLGVGGNVASGSLLGSAACLLAAVSYGVGFVVVRKIIPITDEARLGLAGGQLLMAAVEALVVLPLFWHGTQTINPRSIIAILLLGVMGTGVAYILNYALIHEVGALGASLTPLIMPIFSTLAGALILEERLIWYQPIGAALILVGAWFVQRTPRLLSYD
ncbi:DMT family transporter [Ferrimicrobium sp.]|uniref:DMT family transporter n=1 Tax=Ferrimicrobium sp. TaxID=2926050 RepID=UPI0026369267|nr:DMT family transporter [Ferrimicrobium sp.]